MKTTSALLSAVVVASATSHRPEDLYASEANCGSCMDIAMDHGKKATFNSDCFDSTGLLGCISVETPGQSSLYNGCQFCEFDQFSDVPCDNTDCPDVMDMPLDTPVVADPVIEVVSIGVIDSVDVFDPIEVDPIDPVEATWDWQTCMDLANPGEIIVWDNQCLLDNGGLGCIQDEIDHNVYTGCRYCGFGQYSEVPCLDEQGVTVEDLTTLEIRRSLVPSLRRSMYGGRGAGLRRKGIYGNIAGLRRYGQVAGLRRYGKIAGMRRKGLTYGNVAGFRRKGLRRYGKIAGFRRKGLTYGNVAGLRRKSLTYGNVAGLRRKGFNFPHTLRRTRFRRAGKPYGWNLRRRGVKGLKIYN